MVLWTPLIAGTMGLSRWATSRVRLNCTRLSKVAASSGMSGAEAAQQILAIAGVNLVAIVVREGSMSGCYDPLRKRLGLSRDKMLYSPLPLLLGGRRN